MNCSSLVFWSLLLICMRDKTSQIKSINAKVFRCDMTLTFFQTGLLGNLSNRGKNEGKISCNGVENEVQSKPDLFLWHFNKHQKVFYEEEKLQIKIKTNDKATRQNRHITNPQGRKKPQFVQVCRWVSKWMKSQSFPIISSSFLY